MSWIDIVFIAIIAIFAVIGLAKGFFDSILGLITSVGALFIAIWAAKPTASFIRKIANIDKWFDSFLEKTAGVGESTTFFGHEFARGEVASFLTVVAAVIIVFFLIKASVWLLAKLFESATLSSSALSGMNRLFGLAFGAAKGFFIICVVLAAVSILSWIQPLGESINNHLNNTSITKFVYGKVDEFVEGKLSNDTLKEIIDSSTDAPSEDETPDGEEG